MLWGVGAQQRRLGGAEGILGHPGGLLPLCALGKIGWGRAGHGTLEVAQSPLRGLSERLEVVGVEGSDLRLPSRVRETPDLPDPCQPCLETVRASTTLPGAPSSTWQQAIRSTFHAVPPRPCPSLLSPAPPSKTAH